MLTETRTNIGTPLKCIELTLEQVNIIPFKKNFKQEHKKVKFAILNQKILQASVSFSSEFIFFLT